jgi:tight adherence protein B
MKDPLLAACALTVSAITAAAWLTHKMRLSKQQQKVVERIESSSPTTIYESDLAAEILALYRRPRFAGVLFLEDLEAKIHKQLARFNRTAKADQLIMFCLSLAMIVTAVSILFMPVPFAIACGVALASLPVLAVYLAGSMQRDKFLTQLPSAIDMIASSMMSGHTVSIAVQAIADEIPAPCGEEFKQVSQRLYLGEPLADALNYSVQKYDSFELDLVKNAIEIQQEVGGSLAELLGRTNYTLRERLELKEKLDALTTHSRLTATIVALLPVVILLVFQATNSNYLSPLFGTEDGRRLFALSIALYLSGALAVVWLANKKP